MLLQSLHRDRDVKLNEKLVLNWCRQRKELTTFGPGIGPGGPAHDLPGCGPPGALQKESLIWVRGYLGWYFDLVQGWQIFRDSAIIKFRSTYPAGMGDMPGCPVGIGEQFIWPPYYTRSIQCMYLHSFTRKSILECLRKSKKKDNSRKWITCTVLHKLSESYKKC